jgi:hypothetical protein
MTSREQRFVVLVAEQQHAVGVVGVGHEDAYVGRVRPEVMV